jgi:DNA polymerase-4
MIPPGGGDRPLTLASWPRAILHLDADAFFASCEQALHPEYRGRPVITGKERGIVAAASYEAKDRGVKRGMRLFEVRKACPDAVILPSDYESYGMFSLRMFDILRRFSPDVEEYSIDEAFVDLTGLRASFHGPYAAIAARMQQAVLAELDLPVSVGVSLSKVLAKIASRHGKPRGLVAIPGDAIHRYLEDLPVGKVWGIGPNTAAYLGKMGIETALQFARQSEDFVARRLAKPYQGVWHELNGRSVSPVTVEERSAYQSISKTRTFTPPSGDETFVFAQLSKNLENACIKARRNRLAAARLAVFLRGQDYGEAGLEMRLTRPSAYPAELLAPLRRGFAELYRPGRLYRLTGVALASLTPEDAVQRSLFDDPARIERSARIYRAVDALSARFGKHAVRHASSLPAKLQAQHEGARGDVPVRRGERLRGENDRQRLGIPMVYVKI